jgi:leucyl aminopeptidase
MPAVPNFRHGSGAAADEAGDVLLVGSFSGENEIRLSAQAAEVDERLGGLLGGLAEAGFKGTAGELFIAPTSGAIGAKSVAVLGLGKEEGLKPRDIRRATGTAGRKLSEVRSIVCALPTGDDAALTSAAAEGLVLGSYRYTRFKSDAKPALTEAITFVGMNEAAAERGVIKAGAAHLARDLINEPASTLTPAALAERAVNVAEEFDLESEVWGPDKLQERGFGGVLGVSQGSEQEPRFVQLRYRPENPTGKIILVGKGVTYDTGGYSLKPPASMEQMKTDMSGAAAVIGTMSVLGRLGIKVEVTALLPMTENLVSGRAVKPGDVLKHYGGQTSEIMNTDAEGRLILADALAFGSELGADAIVDIATLTGHMMVALGNDAGGLFASDDDLARELDEAGQSAGEVSWRMPLWPDYKKKLDSEIADFKNVGPRYGGALTAALFLQYFVDPNIPWAHFDIAGPARSESDRDEISKGGTAFGLRTLIEWLERRSG